MNASEKEAANQQEALELAQYGRQVRNNVLKFWILQECILVFIYQYNVKKGFTS